MKTRFGYVLGLTLTTAHFALLSTADAQSTACASRSSGDGARIQEASFVPLGGIEQFVTIRGDDRSNPVLLHVHGGPGIAFSSFAAEFMTYEADFTVVQWDQRGSGCTYGRHGQAIAELTLDRLARDGVELAEYLSRRLDSPKIVVLGHSFGSIVGIEMVRRSPERFALYVGTAQFASFARTVESQLAHLRGVAAGDPELTSQLDAIAELDSQSLQKFGSVNRLLSAGLPAADTAFMQRLQSRAAEVMSPTELADWQAGRQASISVLLPQIAGVDLFTTTRRLEAPFVVIQGAHDLITPTDAARAYFEQVVAPEQELVVIEGAGHFAFLTHAPQVLAVVRRHARAAPRDRSPTLE